MNSEKWGKIREQGRTKYIIKQTLLNVVLSSIMLFFVWESFVNVLGSILAIWFVAALLSLSYFGPAFWWNRYENKYSNK